MNSDQHSPAPTSGSPDQLDAVLERSRELGFLGPGPIAPQREHARAFIDPLGSDPLGIDPPATGGRILDLGSGGGLPGLVLAHEMPGLEFHLLDGMRRRCDFLAWAAEELQMQDRVVVDCGRAEELARDPSLRGTFDSVVARSFGAPAVLAECAVGFLRGPGSRILVSEPPSGDGDRWPYDGLALLGLEHTATSRSHGGTITTLTVVSPAPERYPRRVGIPTKRPLF